MRSPDSVTAPQGPQCATAHIFAVQELIFPSYDQSSVRSDDLRPGTKSGSLSSLRRHYDGIHTGAFQCRDSLKESSSRVP